MSVRFIEWLSNKVHKALGELLLVSEGKDPNAGKCKWCEAGNVRTYDGFHCKRKGVYVKCTALRR